MRLPYLKIHLSFFRLGTKTYEYGVIYRLPFARLFRALGKEVK